MMRPLDLSRLIRVLHAETGLVFEATVIGERQDKILLRLNGVCVHEQPLPVRDELAVAEALPNHLHSDSNTLEDRYFLTRFVAKEARDSYSRLRSAMNESGLDASRAAALDDATGSLFDHLELRSAADFFSLSDTQMRAVMQTGAIRTIRRTPK